MTRGTNFTTLTTLTLVRQSRCFGREGRTSSGGTVPIGFNSLASWGQR